MKVGLSEDKLMNQVRKRVPFSILIVSILFSFLMARVWYLQILKYEDFKILSENNRIRILPVVALRGKILDRHNKEIVNNRPSFNLVLIPEDVKNLDQVLTALQVKFDFKKEKIVKDIKSIYQPFQKINIKKDLSRDEVAFVEENKLDFPGVFLGIEPLRNYKFGIVAPHLLGYMSEISRRQKAKAKYSGYLLGSFIGQFGLEKKLESYLKGNRGTKWVEVDATGREISTIKIKKPVPGNNVVLSIDIELQREAEKLFEGKNGSLVLIDLRDGSVLSLVSSPGFDPNLFASGVSVANWNKLLKDPFKPLQNRAIQGQYPPGSVYKVITASAGLEEGVITPETVIDCPGHFRLGRGRYRCWKKRGHGKVNLRKAIVESCDVYFYTVGLRLGINKLAKYGYEFGIGNKTGIALSGEKRGIVPTSGWKKKVRNEEWIAGETISCSIGQGFNLMTPLQMAIMMGGIATNGVLWKPMIVRKIVAPDGTVIKENKPEVNSNIDFRPETLPLLREALYDAVNSRRGTARRARVKGYDVAGKTGTAQVVRLKDSDEEEEEEIPFKFRDHAWFAGYAPAEDPRIAFAVLVEHGGHGGAAAAPIAKKIVEKFAELEKLKTAKMNYGKMSEQIP